MDSGIQVKGNGRGRQGRRVVLALALSIIVFPAAAMHQQSSGGAETCADYASQARRSERMREAVAQWMMGYLTGRSEADPNSQHQPFAGRPGIEQRIAAYCKANPEGDMDAAAASFFDEAGS